MRRVVVKCVKCALALAALGVGWVLLLFFSGSYYYRLTNPDLTLWELQELPGRFRQLSSRYTQPPGAPGYRTY